MVVHAYYPLGEPRVEREAKAATREGYRVEVVCLRQAGEPKREVVDGIEVHRLGITHQRGAGLIALLREYLAFAVMSTFAVARLRLRARGCAEHIVQVHAPPEFLVVAGALPKLFGSKLILDIHDLSKHLYGARYGGSRATARILGLGLSLTERISCAIADQVITVHEPYRAELVANKIPAPRITVVMNSADEALIDRVLENGNGNGRPPRTAGAPFTLAYHGTITPAYGVDLIIEALPAVLEEAPDTRCTILGEGDALPAVQQRAAELGVSDRVDFSGRYLPIADALQLVAAADCGVIPNRPLDYNRFALSSKLFEYVALGVPAVVAALQTLTRHFGADDVTFFEPGDPAALAKAIISVARHPEAAREKAARARVTGREYSWSEHRTRYLGVLERS
jgi:glycosyltransferase involved in cell wall biosynthesis